MLKRCSEITGDNISGPNPCSVVSTSFPLTQPNTPIPTHTLGTLVKAVVAGDVAVRSGWGQENRLSGLMAVKASTTESVLSHPPHPPLFCFVELLTARHSNDIRLAGTWEEPRHSFRTCWWNSQGCVSVFLPVACCSDRQHSDVWTTAKHLFCSLPGTCRCYLGNRDKKVSDKGCSTICKDGWSPDQLKQKKLKNLGQEQMFN